MPKIEIAVQESLTTETLLVEVEATEQEVTRYYWLLDFIRGVEEEMEALSLEAKSLQGSLDRLENDLLRRHNANQVQAASEIPSDSEAKE